jgi:hypothetical protein
MARRLLAYFDTSVLVKRYVSEKGSTRARSLLRQYGCVSSVLAPLEVLSALYRLHAGEKVAQIDFGSMLSRFFSDRDYWQLIEVSSIVLEKTEELLKDGTLRTLDAVHVASALSFQTITGLSLPFITGDVRQGEAAGRLGCKTVWVAG